MSLLSMSIGKLFMSPASHYYLICAELPLIGTMRDLLKAIRQKRDGSGNQKGERRQQGAKKVCV